MEMQKTTAWQLLLNLIFFIPVTLKISGKWLCQRAYGSLNTDGWKRRIPTIIIGVLIGIFAGWQSADFLAFKYGLGTASWLLGFLLVGVLSYTHVWSALYYFALRFVWDLWDKIWKYYDRLWKEFLLPAIAKAVDLIKLAPGSSALWSKLQSESGRPSNGVRFIEALLLVAILAGAGECFYLSYSWVLLAIGSFVGANVIAGAAGLVAIGALFALVNPASTSQAFPTVVTYSALAAGALVTYVPIVAGQVIWAKIAIFSIALLVGIAYVVPALVILLQGGMIKAVLKQWRRLLDSSYGDEADKDYMRFFQHTANIVLAVVLTWAFYTISIQTGLPLWLATTIGAITLVYSYTEGFQSHFGNNDGNRDIAAVVVALTAFAVYQAAPSTSMMVNVALVVAALFGTALIAYPLVYITARALTRPIAAPIGLTLESIHTKLSRKIVAVFKVLREKQREAFDDHSQFAAMFGHLLNLVILTVALIQALPVVSTTLTNNIYLDIAIAAFVSINGFVLLGRLFSTYSGATLSFVSGITTLAAVGYHVNAITGSLVTAALLGLLAATIVGSVIAPLFYLQVAKVFAPFTAKVAPLVIRVFDSLWAVYKALWLAIGRQFAYLLVLLAPVLAAVARTWQVIAAQIEHMFGVRR